MVPPPHGPGTIGNPPITTTLGTGIGLGLGPGPGPGSSFQHGSGSGSGGSGGGGGAVGGATGGGNGGPAGAMGGEGLTGASGGGGDSPPGGAPPPGLSGLPTMQPNPLPGLPVSGVPSGPAGDQPLFACPRRPNLGREGRPIMLRANHFQITMPRGYIHHYMVTIQPDKCPRKVNRDIIETMVHAYSKIFGTKKPVFDGRSNLYTRDPLPIGNEPVELEVTLPGEGKDRVFRVSIKWVAQVSLYALEEALEGRTRIIPFDAIQVGVMFI